MRININSPIRKLSQGDLASYDFWRDCVEFHALGISHLCPQIVKLIREIILERFIAQFSGTEYFGKYKKIICFHV